MDEYDEKIDRHAKTQAKYFNEKVKIFNQSIPNDIVQKTLKIVNSTQIDPDDRILDIGTGTGVLIEHFLNSGVPPSNILGLDLTINMVKTASDKYKEVYFGHGDFLKFPNDTYFYLNNAAIQYELPQFSKIFFNACFGNIIDQSKAITKAMSLLANLGKIIISHPLGNSFVKKLHDSDPEIVPHSLPDLEFYDNMTSRHNLKLVQFEDSQDFYLAILVKQE